MWLELRASGRLRALGPQWPTVDQPSQVEKEVLLDQYSSLSLSPAHVSHTTIINPFENKVWEIFFYKEVCSFVHWSSYIMFDYVLHIFVYVSWVYNSIQPDRLLSKRKKLCANKDWSKIDTVIEHKLKPCNCFPKWTEVRLGMLSTKRFWNYIYI